MIPQNLIHVVKVFFQWWLTSDQILFRRFMAHESMLQSLIFALAINLWGSFVLYVPLNFLIPKEKYIEIRNYLQNKFPFVERHWKKANELSEDFENSRLGLLKSSERREKAISRLIDTYGYDYLIIFFLSAVPVPFLSTAMTAGALFAVETFEIRFGLVAIVLGKISKVFALASIAFFAYFI